MEFFNEVAVHLFVIFVWFFLWGLWKRRKVLGLVFWSRGDGHPQRQIQCVLGCISRGTANYLKNSMGILSLGSAWLWVFPDKTFSFLMWLPSTIGSTASKPPTLRMSSMIWDNSGWVPVVFQSAFTHTLTTNSSKVVLSNVLTNTHHLTLRLQRGNRVQMALLNAHGGLQLKWSNHILSRNKFIGTTSSITDMNNYFYNTKGLGGFGVWGDMVSGGIIGNRCGSGG